MQIITSKDNEIIKNIRKLKEKKFRDLNNEYIVEGIKMIKEAGADESVIKLRSLEAFEAAADGQATKIIIPSDIQNIAGLVTSVTEIAKSKK